MPVVGCEHRQRRRAVTPKPVGTPAHGDNNFLGTSEPYAPQRVHRAIPLRRCNVWLEWQRASKAATGASGGSPVTVGMSNLDPGPGQAACLRSDLNLVSEVLMRHLLQKTLIYCRVFIFLMSCFSCLICSLVRMLWFCSVSLGIVRRDHSSTAST